MTTDSDNCAVELLEVLHRRGLTVSTAESCTGGNIAHLITLVPGSSDVFMGGIVSYSNDVKHRVLGVSLDTLEANGAVSEPVVEAMTAGACRACATDCAVATSGIAGPGGAVSGKPVGTVWIAARCRERVVAHRYQFAGSRGEVIAKASVTALAMLLALIESTDTDAPIQS